MSVPRGDRKKSGMQFIETADRIEDRAIDICRKWPKSWRFVITNRTLALASAIVEHAQAANAIYPITTESEREERVRELLRALGANYAFAKKIERAYSKFPLCGEDQRKTPDMLQEKSNKLLEEMMTLCMEEEEALKGNITFTRKAELAGGKPESSDEKDHPSG